MKRLVLLLAAGAVAMVAGCRTQQTVTAPAGPPPVNLRAYINVSSGCQEPTVQFLRGLKEQYPRLALEVIDFGDGGAGMERWQQSGHKCMTMEINGQSVVKYPQGDKLRAVAFRMPAGFLWTHEDLAEAVKAAMEGRLQPSTEDEAMAETSPEQVKAKLEQLRKLKSGKAAAARKK
jgi:hypothetical protein